MSRNSTVGKKILLVDDAEADIEWTKEVLEDAGYHFFSTNNPVLVPSFIFKERPDLVLIDLSMPLLDGEQVARINKDASISPILVIYSGRDADELKEISRRCMVDGFIKKTSRSKELIEQVRAFLDSDG